MATSISILGNTGRDVELRYTPQGTPVAGFSVASNSFRNTTKGKEQKTDWYNVTAYGRQAETLSQHLKKGNQILVRGKLTFNPWTDREGQARVSADVQLQDFEFIGGNTTERAVEASARSSKTAARAQNSPVAQDDDNPLTDEMIAALRETDGAEADDYLNHY